MLNCIIGMVDKARRALAVLQERSIRDREELSIWMRRHPDNDHDLKKRGGPETWSNMRNSDDRIDDVRRRAGEVVLLYSETCLKQPLRMKIKNWFSLPIIA